MSTNVTKPPIKCLFRHFSKSPPTFLYYHCPRKIFWPSLFIHLTWSKFLPFLSLILTSLNVSFSPSPVPHLLIGYHHHLLWLCITYYFLNLFPCLLIYFIIFCISSPPLNFITSFFSTNFLNLYTPLPIRHLVRHHHNLSLQISFSPLNHYMIKCCCLSHFKSTPTLF